jgi:hypothetical protein
VNSWNLKGMLAAAIMLPALGGAAWADDFKCSNAPLQGDYAFGVTNYNAPQIHVAAGIKHFYGNGKMTQRDYRGNTLPIQLSDPGQESGTYTLNPDCSGILETQVANGTITALIVVYEGGRYIHEVVGTLVPTGSMPPGIPVQTSADDWKIAPDSSTQNQQ